MKNSINIKDVTVCFGSLRVLDSFNCSITKNTAITGPSGCGKTTLIRAIMGLCELDGGSISFGSKPKFSAVFQEDRLFEGFSAIENVGAVCEKHLGKSEAQRIASEIPGELLISDEEQGKAVGDYSGGMKRRVAIARALAAQSDILVLDEPYKGLDEKTREVCAECIKRRAKDKLVLLITHDKDEISLTGIEEVLAL